MKKHTILSLVLAIVFSIGMVGAVNAASCWELHWSLGSVNYQGLLLIADDGTAMRTIYTNGSDQDVVDQELRVRYVNGRTVLLGYNPRTASGRTYAADNFILFEDDSIGLLDDAGNYSVVNAWQINDNELGYYLRKYGF